MKSFLKQFARRSKAAALTPEELEQGKASLRAYMAEYPLPVRNAESARQLKQTREFFPSFSFLRHKFMPIIAIILAVMLAGGGVSYAAEQSLPGDALYPVKVSVNEPVREALTPTSEGKAQWEIRVAERRLEEAEHLSAEGKLDAEARARVEENFQKHIEDVRERIQEFEGKDLHEAADISAKFEVTLQAHDKVLAKLAESHEGDTKSIQERVHEEEAQAQQKREDLEQKLKEDDDSSEEARKDSQHAAQEKMKEVQKKVDEVKATVEKLSQQGKVSAETKAAADAQLAAVDQILADGKQAFDAGDYNKAFLAFQTAQRKAKEVKVLVEAEKEFSVKVKLEDGHEESDDRSESKQPEQRKQEDREQKEDSEDDRRSKVETSGSAGTGTTTQARESEPREDEHQSDSRERESD